MRYSSLAHRHITETYIREIFGINVLKCLVDRRMTKRHFAAILAVPETRVRRWCRGESMPPPKGIAEICQVLEVTPSYLLSDHFAESRAV